MICLMCALNNSVLATPLQCMMGDKKVRLITANGLSVSCE